MLFAQVKLKISRCYSLRLAPDVGVAVTNTKGKVIIVDAVSLIAVNDLFFAVVWINLVVFRFLFLSSDLACK
jgi:hypothetical protein